MPITALAIGAGVGLLKGELIDRPKEGRQRKLAAETQRLSPWTGLSAGPVQEADSLGSALAFGGTGAQIGYGLDQAELNKKLATRAMDAPATMNYNAGGSPAYNPFGTGQLGGYKGTQNSLWGAMNNYGG